MPIDTSSPRSPGWWFAKLLKQLGDKQDRLNRLHRYYCGDPDLPEGAQSTRQAYRDFQCKARTNFAELVVEAVRERMVPTGFRTGGSGDELGDKEAWRIWQANALDADSSLVDRAALAMGEAYVIVGQIDDQTGLPTITPEDPRQVITVQDPVHRRRPLAGLKVFYDDVQGADLAYLYFPGWVYRAFRRNPTSVERDYSAASTWEWFASPQQLPVPVVPVVKFAYRPQLDGRTLGEFEDHIDVLDRINFMLLQRLVIAAVQAFRQRALKGELPDMDAEGNPIDYNGMFRADPGSLWQLPAGVEMWESSPADLTPILTAVRHDIQDLAAATRTPLFYLTPDAANGSAEGASLAREGLTFKTQDRIVQAGESWEQVMSLAFSFAGDTVRASRPDLEVLWKSPERFSLAERADAASKATALPWRAQMRDIWQYSPQAIEQMEVERATDALLNAPPPPPPAAPVVPANAGI